jgi:hypothetical protein
MRHMSRGSADLLSGSAEPFGRLLHEDFGQIRAADARELNIKGN